MIPIPKCLYCNQKEGIFPLKEWNKDEIEYYCEDHIKLAEKYNEEQKRAFYEYYKSENKKEWLSPKQRELWEKIHKEMK